MTIYGTSSAAAAGAAATDTRQTSDPAANGVSKDTFLKLLVAQIKNQDPLNPTDGTQFLTQLAQFSELEQVMAIREDVDKAVQPATDATPSTAQGGN